jgi:hypothetical protein
LPFLPLLRGQIAGSRAEYAIDRAGERAQGANSREREQNKQEGIFGKVLTFLLLPQTHHQVLHFAFLLSLA